MKFLIDEDISPGVARILCEQLLVDAVAGRDMINQVLYISIDVRASS